MNAIYAGSFDPFTIGHFDILDQACKLFDTVYVVFADNPNKQRRYDLAKMINAVEKDLKIDINNFLVISTKDLIADIARRNGIKYLIRGLRDTSDYLYEENIARINKEINPELNTIYFRSNSNAISSSMVRELSAYGKDIHKYVGGNVLDVILEHDKH